MAKLITVCGATGIEGGSLAKALLQDDSFKVRGITRNVQSSRAKELAKEGAEMVEASFESTSALEQAFEGSYGVFVMTNYWEIKDQDKEVEMGKNIVDVAKKVGVQHVVFSGLQPVKKLIGKACPSFDGKAEIEDYLFASGLSATSVRLAAYMGNVMGALEKTDEGEIILNFPMDGKKLHSIYAKAIGPAVAVIFKNPENYKGQCIGLSGDCKTIQEYCDVINKHLSDVTISVGQMTAEEYAKRERPFADIFGVMFEFYQSEHPSYSIEKTKELDPETKDFDKFIEENIDRLRAIVQRVKE